MEITILSHSEALERAKKIYYAIGQIQCPAFAGEYVHFSNLGFNHLIRTSRSKNSVRPANEQLIRMSLIEYAEQIIKNPKEIVYRKDIQKRKVKVKGVRVLKENIIHYWAFSKTIDNIRMKVVISQIDSREKQFLSIMAVDHVSILER